MLENKLLALYDAENSITDSVGISSHGCVKKTDIIVKNSDTGETIFRGSNKVIIPGSGLIARKLFDIGTDEVTPTYNTKLGIPNPGIDTSEPAPVPPVYIVSVTTANNVLVENYTYDISLEGNVTVHIASDLITGTYSVHVTNETNSVMPGISVTVLDAFGEVINAGNTNTAGVHNFNAIGYDSSMSIINAETSEAVSFTTHHNQTGSVMAVLTSKIPVGSYIVNVLDDANSTVGQTITIRDELGYDVAIIDADESKSYTFDVVDHAFRIMVDGVANSGTFDAFEFSTSVSTAGAVVVDIFNVTMDSDSAIRIETVTPSEVEGEEDIVNPVPNVTVLFKTEADVAVEANSTTDENGVIDFTVDYAWYPVVEPIPEPEVNTTATKDNPKILLFCIGVDGCGTENSQVFPVDYKMWMKPENIVPFRYPLAVNELSDSLRTMYFGRTPIGNRIAYYFKRFDADPKFVQQFIDGTPIDENIFDTDKRDPAESYVELILKITKEDCREWFIATTGINDAKINTVSLCCAYPTTHEGHIYFEDIRPVTKLNFPNELLIDITKGIDIIYHIYM